MKRFSLMMFVVLCSLVACDDAPLIADRGADKDSWSAALPRAEWQVLDHIGDNHRFDDIATLNSDFARARRAGLGHEAVAFAVAEGWIAGATPPGFDPTRYRVASGAATYADTDGVREFAFEGFSILTFASQEP